MRLISSPSGSADTPSIRFFVLVVERFQSLVLLELAQLGWVGEAEESGRKLDQPLGIDRCHLAHVFLGGLYQFVVDDPVD